jgi:hypothetical protein
MQKPPTVLPRSVNLPGTMSEIERTVQDTPSKAVVSKRHQSVTDPVSDPTTGSSL